MKRIFAVVLVLLIGVAFAACAQSQPVQFQPKALDYWPKDTWRTSTPEEQGMDSKVLIEMLRAVEESGKSVNSVTIIRNGCLVHETYFYPYQKEYVHSLNSGTKSFVSAALGIAIDEGKIKSVEDPVLGYFPNWEIANVDQRKQDMKLKDLLSMSTGFDWEFNGNVSTNEMLQSDNWAKFTLDLPMKEEPGKTFNYCNGASQALCSAIKNATGKTPKELLAEKLRPLGFGDFYWESAPEQNSSGYSGIFMHPDDAAKFGYLYLGKGKWDGQQIIPEQWVEDSTKGQVKADWSPILPEYAYHWWVTRFGGYAAFGHGGNYIFVVPKLNLVAVFTGGLFDVSDMFYPGELMEKYIVPSIKSDSPLEADQAVADALSEAMNLAQNAPAPEPVSLPAMAAKVSGKPFVFENVGTYTLNFEESSGECTLTQDGQYTFEVGLDGICRLNDSPGGAPVRHAAFTARWINDNTIEIVAQALEDGFVTTYTVGFEGNVVNLNIRSNLGQNDTLTGTIRN